jgi:hypothetical protein
VDPDRAKRLYRSLPADRQDGVVEKKLYKILQKKLQDIHLAAFLLLSILK